VYIFSSKNVVIIILNQLKHKNTVIESHLRVHIIRCIKWTKFPLMRGKKFKKYEKYIFKKYQMQQLF
jgi:hypothetical protein